MHLYLNYARQHWTQADENPPVGLILCAEKDDAIARYALQGLPNKVLAREYKLALPDEKRLAAEIDKTRGLLNEEPAHDFNGATGMSDMAEGWITTWQKCVAVERNGRLPRYNAETSNIKSATGRRRLRRGINHFLALTDSAFSFANPVATVAAAIPTNNFFINLLV